MNGMPWRALTALAWLALAGWGCTPEPRQGPDQVPATEPTVTPPAIQATNAFYYYRDLPAAWAFYTEVLGLETVADFGFAKILRVAPASFLTLVDVEHGMHDADEAKSTTLALVTDDPEGWWAYLTREGVPMRAELGEVDRSRAHNGFVAVDPEGYYLEFERFNPHEENVALLPLLEEIPPLGPGGNVETRRPGHLTIRATVQWLYYRDIEAALAWYESVLGTRLLVDQGWAKVIQASPTGFLGFVDGARGLHQASEEKAVTVSFFTDDIEGWWERVRGRADLPLRSQEIGEESGRVRTFVGYDPEGYYLEWDAFLPLEENAVVLRYLGTPSGGS